MIEKVQDDNFYYILKDNPSTLVLVDFFAQWCGPCKRLAPILENLAKEFKDQIKIVKIDIEEGVKISSQMSIRSVPTLMLFKDAKQISIRPGFQTKDQLIDWINKDGGVKLNI